MKVGLTRLTAAYNPAGSMPARSPPASSATRGASTPQKGRPRPTMFSHMRLCDSCTPSDSVDPRGVRRSAGDVRITTRWDEEFWATGLYGAMHECGHGLYESGIAPYR